MNNKLKIPSKITGIRRILRAFIFSRDGFKYMLNEDAFRQEILLTIFCGVILLFLKLSLIMKLLMFCSLIFILVVEILNTGMEALVDMITPNFDIRAKEVKDLGSFAVLMSFILSVLIWSVGIYMVEVA